MPESEVFARLSDPASSLLEQAVHYGLSSLDVITPSAMREPTPCAGWDLAALLRHLSESLSALREGACAGRIEMVQPAGARPTGPTEAEALLADLRLAATSLVLEWQRIPMSDNHFAIGELPLRIAVVEVVAAMEIAVHGWDIFESCHSPRPIPVRLALDLLRRSSMLVDDTVRPELFGAPIEISALAGPSDRLVAFLGRRPRRRHPFPT
ncbi:MAG TPA: maleylpyruvate isomerase family mycothiol-dependent enzyme [Kineosporiaceae bacterium]|nr:maleylpyruvate isomerase family mycothiol-dependent enzyme [Kineosporiaceae bacterium]